MFELHPQLAKDCLPVGRFPLCHLLLMRDANYPWCILVPARIDITEIYQLSGEDQEQLMRESSLLASSMTALFSADKMNIAALGNIVPQLHIHHIARRRDDPAWPAPVWGKVPPLSYTEQEQENILMMLLDALQDHLHD